MNHQDSKAFAKIMTALGELYGKAISASLSEIYWVTLKKFSLVEVKQAVAAHISHPRSGQFMPKPADLLRHILEDPEACALAAWSQVLLAIQQKGSYENASFDDSKIDTVIHQMGGWRSLCSMCIDETPFRERAFVTRYQSLLERESAQEYKNYFLVQEASEHASKDSDAAKRMTVMNHASEITQRMGRAIETAKNKTSN